MHRILKPLGSIAAVYLDDILVYATTNEEAITRTRFVLDVFRENGLTLNPAKCKFLVLRFHDLLSAFY